MPGPGNLASRRQPFFQALDRFYPVRRGSHRLSPIALDPVAVGAERLKVGRVVGAAAAERGYVVEVFRGPSALGAAPADYVRLTHRL